MLQCWCLGDGNSDFSVTNKVLLHRPRSLIYLFCFYKDSQSEYFHKKYPEILVFAFTKEPSRDLMVLLCVCGKTGLKSVSRSKPNTNILNWEMITKNLNFVCSDDLPQLTKLNVIQSDSMQLTKLSSTQCNYFHMSVLVPFLPQGLL